MIRREKRQDKIIDILGKVVDKNTRTGLSSLKIEAWLKYKHFNKLIAHSSSDEEGKFKILVNINRIDFNAVIQIPKIVVYFKIYYRDNNIYNSENDVIWNVQTSKDPVIIPIDNPFESEAIDPVDDETVTDDPVSEEQQQKTYFVKGRVLYQSGKPVVGNKVEAFDIDLCEEKSLGEETSAKDGSYIIYYSQNDYSRKNKTKADLIVKAYGKKDEVIAKSPLIIEAAYNQVVDLIIGNKPFIGPSEYDRLYRQVRVYLKDSVFKKTTRECIKYIAAKTKVNPFYLSFLIKAIKIEKRSGISAEIFYGLFRQKLPTNYHALVVQDSRIHTNALRKSIHSNIISKDFEKSIEKTINDLKSLVVESVFDSSSLTKNTFVKLLDTTNIVLDKQKKFLKMYQQHQGENEEFWEFLKKDSYFKDKISELQFTLQLGTLTLNHVPLIPKIKQLVKKDYSIQNLTNLNYEDWMNLINSEVNGEKIGIPDNIPGSNDEEKNDNYIKTMMRMIEDAYPTTFVANRLEKKSFHLADKVKDFLDKNPDFDFRKKRIKKYLEEKKGRQTEKLSEELKAQLNAMQRVFNFTPRYNKSKSLTKLMADGIHSAHKIRNMGKTTFLKKYSKEFGEEAIQIYAKASQTSAVALTLFAKHSAAVNSVPIHAVSKNTVMTNSERKASVLTDGGLRDLGSTDGGIADYQTLFGALDLCECKHCRSVYSPAAYLVDILSFLKKRNSVDKNGNEDGETALDKLLKRRPDLGNIELNCKNTNTVLPYVDLINEVLENAVSPLSNEYQTEWTMDELKAQPEHLNPAAYNILSKEKYPWSLPFDLWVEESRIYLEHLGVNRYKIMELFRKGNAVIKDLDIVNEYLCLTSLESDLICITSVANIGDVWGITSASNQVSKIIEQSGMKYNDIVSLLETEYVNKDNKLFIKFVDADCDLETATIENLKNNHLDRIHRFIRLQRKTNISILELDKTLRAIKPKIINEVFLTNLSYVLYLKDKLKLPLVKLLSFWSLIDTVSKEKKPSLFETIFLNKTNTRINDSIFKLNANNSDLLVTSKKISENKSSIIGALGITDVDLSILMKNELANNDKLNLENLSKLYRATTLSRALRLKISDFSILRELSGINPFDEDNIKETINFIKISELVNETDFSISDLNYLLKHKYPPNAAIVPRAEEIIQFLKDLVKELQSLKDEYRYTPDPQGELTCLMMSVILQDNDTEKAIRIITGDKWINEAEKKSFLDEHFHQKNDILTEDARKSLAKVPDSLILEERFKLVLEPLLIYLKQKASIDLVKQKFASGFELELEACELLLCDLLKSKDGTKKIIEDFLSDNLATCIDKDNPENDCETQFKHYILLNKIAEIIKGYKIPSKKLKWLFTNGSKLEWLDLTLLPNKFDAALKPQFTEWLEIAKFHKLEKELPLVEPTLYEILEIIVEDSFTISDISSKISELTGWKLEDLEFLIGANGCDFKIPDDFKGKGALAILLNLKEIFRIIKRLGTSAVQIWSWATPKVSSNQAFELKQIVKSKYDDTKWQNIAELLRDELRIKQRNSLVDYLVYTKNAYSEPNDLFRHYLIDVEMEPCMKTSRIKQANNSIQLFIQSSLMNLEENVKLTPEDADEWKWMKNYRVWEANRKVFLYPENWIEPELRDDKSPFFLDLENELLQGEITEENAEELLLKYIEKLDEVSRLEISGFFYEDEKKTYHIIGRTYSTPHVYYYRKWIDKFEWTPWERIEVDIEGNHLIPIIYNRRLYIFWPIFIEKQSEKQKSRTTETLEGERARFQFQIKMAWSMNKNGKWSAKKVSNEYVTDESIRNEFESIYVLEEYVIYDYMIEKSSFFFHGYTENNKIQILCCFRFWDDEYHFATFTLPDSNANLLAETFRCNRKRLQDKEIPLSCKEENMKYKRMGFLTQEQPFTDDLIKVLNNASGFFRTTNQHESKLNYQDLVSPVSPFGSIIPIIVDESFFYEDNKRTFLVIPKITGDPYIYDSFKLSDQSKAGLTSLATSQSLLSQFTSQTSNLGDAINSSSQVSNIDVVYGGTNINAETYKSQSVLADGYGAIQAAIIDMTQESSISTFEVEPSSIQFAGHLQNVDEVLVDSHVNPGFFFDISYKMYRFIPFYHPYASFFIKQINRYGIEGILNPHFDNQNKKLIRQQISMDYFNDIYKPIHVEKPYPINKIDFSYEGAYSIYNWELFFHTPFHIANQLSNNQKFEDAQKWYHYIFDPTDVSDKNVPARFWKIKPFFEESLANKPIQDLLKLLHYEGNDSETLELRDNLNKQIEKWRKDPFKPHLIARLRISAYQKTIIMKYLDNLIAWGDSEFRRFSIESVNAATQLYVLAAQILGKEPEDVPAHKEGLKLINGIEVKTFNDIKDHLDEFSNILIDIETELPPTTFTPDDEDSPTSFVIGPTFFFCIPKNEKLLSYWKKVAEQIFKIRHCQDIEGVERQMPLFEPPIDPAMLVRAAAAGIDISSAISDLNAPLPYYRFESILNRALDFCNDVKSYGANLLNALEKRDAEEISLTRSKYEVQLLKAMKDIRKKQVKEAEESINTIEKNKEAAEARKNYYDSLEYMNANETLHERKTKAANFKREVAQEIQITRTVLALIPDLNLGADGFAASPVAEAKFGGINISDGLDAASQVLNYLASMNEQDALMASIRGGYDRRQADWTFQVEQSTIDIKSIDKQLEAAKLRKEISDIEQTNHEKQIDNLIEIDTFMRDKFTNKQLHSWMISQIATTYFQSYKMAYDLAKRTERAFQYELGIFDSNFIQFGYWDSLKKGLLSGEKLAFDLRRMQKTYIEKNKREYEIVKNVSLASLDPIALIMLKEKGKCYVHFPETIFDIDYPGHYMRRVKSVSLTIPCIVGPYTSVNCTLTLLENQIRIKNDPESANDRKYALVINGSDNRFKDNLGGIQSIVTSNANNDSGLFELNFRDERYLPFEGAGVISKWRLELPEDFKQFDYDTISDVIFHIKYTSRDGGKLLKKAARNELTELINAVVIEQEKRIGQFRYFSLTHEFPDDWHQFLHPVGTEQKLSFDIKSRFPFKFINNSIEVNKVALYLKLNKEYFDTTSGIKIKLTKCNEPTDKEEELTKYNDIEGLLNVDIDFKNEPGCWTIHFTDIPNDLKDNDTGFLKQDVIDDLAIVCHYTIK